MLPSATKDDLNNLKSASQATACDMKDDLHNAVHQAGRNVRSLFNATSDEIDVVTTEIRTNPLRSSAIALGVGLLLGRLFRL